MKARGIVLVVVLLGILGAMQLLRTRRASPATSTRLSVPRTSGELELDGETEEDSWLDATRTGPFVDAAGKAARPYTEARFLRDDRMLYLHLYAADEDLRAPAVGKDGPLWLGDRFVVTIHASSGDRIIEVSPRGELADSIRRGGTIDRSWSSGALLDVDLDGTLDNASDSDEEWAVELALPLVSLGGETELAITIERHDIGANGRRYSRFDGVLDLR